jgi:glucose-1-phosphatase
LSEKHDPSGSAHKSIKAVIFDLGGVILRTEDPTPRTRLAESVGKTRQQLEEIVFSNPVSLLAEEGQSTPAQVWEYVRQALALNPEDVAGFRRTFFGGDRVDFEIIELLRSLRPAFRTGLLSNTWLVDLPRFLVEDLKIPLDTFDGIVSSAHYRAAKPKSEIYQVALRELQVQPQQAVFVDDNALNIEGAQTVGMHVIFFKNSGQAIQELLKYVQIL